MTREIFGIVDSHGEFLTDGDGALRQFAFDDAIALAAPADGWEVVSLSPCHGAPTTFVERAEVCKVCYAEVAYPIG